MFIDLEREEGREREKYQYEKYQLVASHLLPDQESNLQPFCCTDDVQPTEPPGQDRNSLFKFNNVH